MKLVTSKDCQLRVEHTPRPGAPALLLLNPLGVSLDIWDEQLTALSARYELIRFDARGHGKSTIGEQQEATIELLAQDAQAVLEACGVARAHLCGISLGGMIAMHLAAHTPDCVLKVVLSNTTPHMPPRENWEQRIQSVRAQGLEPLIEGTLSRWFTPEFHQAQPDKVAKVRTLLRETTPAGYAACCAAIRDMDQRESIRNIASKTLVIGGTKDAGTTPAMAQSIASSVAEAKLVMLEAAHLTNIERADDFNAAVIEFLEGELAPAPAID